MESYLLHCMVILTAFAIQIIDCQEDCKYSSYDPRGTYESPGYPDGYPENADCMYRIFADTNINIRFESFSLQDGQDCNHDSLTVIFDATSQNPNQRRYCGNGLNRIDGGDLRGLGPAILLFRSDHAENMAGFKFNFEYEFTGPNPCDSTPCANDGTCVRMIGYYMCECVEGFRGKSCEVDWDDCSTQPCQNGGQCQDGPNNYSCDCINNYNGDTCEIEPDPCDSAPCMNGGLCNNQIPYFICECPKSFYGALCEDPVPTPAPPPTTPAPTTVAVTTTTTEAPTTTKAGENENSGIDEGGIPQESVDDMDVNKAGEQSGDSSGAIAAAFIICILLIALAAFLIWYWSRSNGNAEGGKDFDISKLKSNVKKAINKKKQQFMPSKPSKTVTKPVDHTNKPRQLPRDLIIEEIESEDDGRRKRRTKGKRKTNPGYHMKDDPHPGNRNNFGQSHDDKDFDFLDQNRSPKKIDLSPEEAVAVLNQLLNNEPRKPVANFKDMLTPKEIVKQKRNDLQDSAMHNKSLPGSVSDDDESIRKTKEKRSDRRRNTRKPRDDDNKRLDDKRHRSRRLAPSQEQTLESSSVKYEKTQDPTDKVKNWLKSSTKAKNTRVTPSPDSISTIYSASLKSKSSRSSASTRKTQNSIEEEDISLEDYDYNDEDSTIIPSPEFGNPKPQNKQDIQMLPVTKNKAKSLVDKLVRAPIKSKENYVGPRLGVKRENAFLD